MAEIQFKPGILSNTTDRGAGLLGYWKDGDHIRFVDGFPRKMLGWTRDNSSEPAIEGTPRGMHDWKTNGGARHIAVGTESRLYVWQGGQFFDITPSEETSTLTNPFTTTNLSTIVSVTDVDHGRQVGDRVIFDNATAVGGITIDGEYSVTEVVSTSVYKITHTSAATSSAGPGGGTVDYQYLIRAGRATSLRGVGFGSGAYGASTYGTARTLSSTVLDCRVWTLDHWGEDLIAGYNDGKIFVWDASLGTTANRAQLMTNAPSTIKAVLVSQEDRQVIALGAHSGSANDPMRIRWCSMEDYTDWTATETNTAGSKRLDGGNFIVGALKGKGEHLIYTDTHLFSFYPVGPPNVFGTRPLGPNGGMRGAHAGVFYNGIAYWMGFRDFFAYDGGVRVLPCAVNDHVFGDINDLQRFKVCCGVNREHEEVWWFYCGSGVSEIDRYVVYHTTQNTWSYGTMSRVTYQGDSGVFEYAFAMGSDGYLYVQDSTVDANGSAISSSLQSGDVEIGDGSALMLITKIAPDFKDLTGTVKITLIGRKYPQSPAAKTITKGPFTVSPDTPHFNPRMKCRQVSFKIESTEIGDYWELGMVRMELRPYGKR